MKRSVLIQKKYYDRKTHLIKHKVGDAVMVRNMPRPEAGTAKFHDKYIGPYYIVDVLSDVNFRICDKPDGKTKVIHHDRLKPIEQRKNLISPGFMSNHEHSSAGEQLKRVRMTTLI